MRLFEWLRQWYRRKKRNRRLRWVAKWRKRWESPPENTGLVKRMFREMANPRRLEYSSGGWNGAWLEVELWDGYIITSTELSLWDCYVKAAEEVMAREGADDE